MHTEPESRWGEAAALLGKSKEHSARGPVVAGVGSPGSANGSIRLVSAGTFRDTQFIEDWVTWRRHHAFSFLTVFEPSADNATNYFNTVYLRDPSKFLFEFLDVENRRFGFAGLSLLSPNMAELGNILRAPRAESAPRMSEFCLELLCWAANVLLISEFELVVLADNLRAKRMYERIGFHATEMKPLKKVSRPEGYQLVVCDDAESDQFSVGLLKMNLHSRDLPKGKSA